MHIITFYKEWLPLPKEDFRVLTMIADKNPFCGTLTDACEYLGLTPQTRNRNKISQSLTSLSLANLISLQTVGRTLTATPIPQATAIRLDSSHVELIRTQTHIHSSSSVSWEAVLKTFLWLIDNDAEVITNAMIAAVLNISESTVSSATTVLSNLSAVNKDRIITKVSEGNYRCVGQTILPCAWWIPK